MYILFEISDKYIIMFGVIVFVILTLTVTLTLAFKSKNKVKPISEQDRFEDSDDVVEFKKVEELTEEQKKARAELERVLNQMNADLQKEQESVVDSFEREQEENAIISYQELIKQVKGIDSVELPVQEEKKEEIYNPEIYEPIEKESDLSFLGVRETEENYLEALENVKATQRAIEYEERKPYSGTKTKFSTSEIISPIFGRQDPSTIQNNDNFKVDDVYESMGKDDEQKQNAEFLNTLKEFRNNL